MDHPTGTKDLATGPHKEKGFDAVEIVTQGDSATSGRSGVASDLSLAGIRTSQTQGDLASSGRSGVTSDAGIHASQTQGDTASSGRSGVTSDTGARTSQEGATASGVITATLEVSLSFLHLNVVRMLEVYERSAR